MCNNFIHCTHFIGENNYVTILLIITILLKKSLCGNTIHYNHFIGENGDLTILLIITFKWKKNILNI